MVQTPKVEKRVRTILAPGKNRAEMTSSLRAVALVSTAAVLVAGAVVRLSAVRSEAKDPAQPSPPFRGPAARSHVTHSTRSNARFAAHGGVIGREPQFPEGGRSPAGVVRLEEMAFKPVGGNAFPVSALQVRLDPGGSEMSVVQARTGDVLWRGPASGARFALETVSAVNTLKDASGRTLWHDEADVLTHLMLDKSADGTSRLFDSRGAVLWSGYLGPAPGASSVKQHEGTSQLVSSGVLITGTDGAFSVYSDPEIQAPLPPELLHSAPLRPGPNARLLWSGKLPAQPTILIRDGKRFRFTSPDRSESGVDRTTEVRFTTEVGQVTIEDMQGRTLGSQAVDILKCRHDTRNEGPGPRIGYYRPPLMPEPELAATARGTVLLTYRDSTGSIVRRAKVYRDEEGTGSSMN